MKALIVEDDAEIRRVLSAVLKRSGYKWIDTAETGEQGIGLAVSTRYDLITLDVHLPGVSGIDILSVIRNLSPGGIIAIVSAFLGDLSAEELASADVVFDKPIRMEKVQELAQLAKEIRERREGIRALSDLPEKEERERNGDDVAQILVIDDDLSFRTALRILLQGAGYEVIEALEGKAGIHLYREKRPDLVIIDIIMPGMEGLETIRALKQDFPDVKIIAISGSGARYLDMAEAFGALRTFEKPYGRGELLQAIQEVLEV